MAFEKNRFDYMFIGMGASNSLILISLIKNGLIADKKVAVLEVDSKDKNDKTYCFWAAPDESIVTELSSIISYKFTHIRVNASAVHAIETCPYHYIRSIDLYKAAFEMLENAQIRFFQRGVTKLTFENELYALHTEDEIYYSKYVFDSRPPNIHIKSGTGIHLHQSFYGWHIKCQNEVFQKNTFDMMNFQIEQHHFTQFVYVLPFSSKEALVELTRFGAEKIELDYASNLLENYITEAFGSYEKLGEEVGCIPMTTFKNSVNSFEGVLNTGAGANLIKPSTGYGFKNMFYFAKAVTDSIASGNLHQFNRININSKERFNFYDHLLLIILFHWPSLGKKIFTRLFNKVPVLQIFSFLEEKTSLREEIHIFRTLPIKPFLKALFLYVKSKGILRYMLALVAVMAYLSIAHFHNATAQTVNYLLLVFGFLAMGIPHGALDHLLSKNKKTPLPIFIFNYLMIMGAYLMLWYVFPVFSLFIFFAYSAFHFGESELIQNKEQLNTVYHYAKAFLLGLSILIFIVSTHFEESIRIISSITNGVHLSRLSFDLTSWSAMASLTSITFVVLNFLSSKSLSSLGLMLLLLLGTLVPLSMAFGLYFILQHSVNAWGHLKKGLDMSSRELYLKAFPFTFGALLIFLLMAYFLNSSTTEWAGIWAIFFVFIACISLPHFILMHLFYASKK